MPGCELGDLGCKLGYKTKDNGYLILNKVRIPRENLLMKYVEVDREGNFKKKGDLRILYSTMLASRIEIVNGAPFYLC